MFLITEDVQDIKGGPLIIWENTADLDVSIVTYASLPLC